MIFPPFPAGSRNSRENCSRHLLASYIRELQIVPVLVSKQFESDCHKQISNMCSGKKLNSEFQH